MSIQALDIRLTMGREFQKRSRGKSAEAATLCWTTLNVSFRSLLLHKLDTAHQNEVLDLLFTEKGAGFTILRNGLGSSPDQPFDFMKSIAPTAPASNDSEVRPKRRF